MFKKFICVVCAVSLIAGCAKSPGASLKTSSKAEIYPTGLIVSDNLIIDDTQTAYPIGLAAGLLVGVSVAAIFALTLTAVFCFHLYWNWDEKEKDGDKVRADNEKKLIKPSKDDNQGEPSKDDNQGEPPKGDNQGDPHEEEEEAAK
jgi:hypothetical protein